MVDNGVAGIETTLEERCRNLYGAYEYLRENDLCSVSFTSDTLHYPDFELIRSKVVEQISQLRRVLKGTHLDKSPSEDLVQQSQQLMYWLILGVAASGVTYRTLRLHWHLLLGYDERAATGDIALELREFELRFSENTTCQRAGALMHGSMIIGQACRLYEVNPLAVVNWNIGEIEAPLNMAYNIPGGSNRNDRGPPR